MSMPPLIIPACTAKPRFSSFQSNRHLHQSFGPLSVASNRRIMPLSPYQTHRRKQTSALRTLVVYHQMGRSYPAVISEVASFRLLFPLSLINHVDDQKAGKTGQGTIDKYPVGQCGQSRARKLGPCEHRKAQGGES